MDPQAIQQVATSLESLLLKVSTLTDLAEKNSVNYFQEVTKWMKEAEVVFIENGIIVGARIAAMRGILLSVDNDNLLPEGMQFRTEPSRSRLKRAAASVFLQKTVESVLNYLITASASLGSLNKNSSANG